MSKNFNVNTLLKILLNKVLLSRIIKVKRDNMKDFMSKHEEEVRELSLMQEEAHYVHTINAFVELIVLYGWDKVTSDLRAAMGEKKW
jgi:hypothetical protein